jgi:hypothetical protein
LQDLLAERLLLDGGDELAHHRQRNVRLQQRNADLAQHLLGVGFRQPRFAAHRLDDAGQSLGKAIEHVRFPWSAGEWVRAPLPALQVGACRPDGVTNRAESSFHRWRRDGCCLPPATPVTQGVGSTVLAQRRQGKLPA